MPISPLSVASSALPAPPLPTKSLSTPRLIHVGLAALALSLLLFWIAGTGVIIAAESGVRTIGRDTAPSVVAAQQIRAHLANMDANAANAALTRGAAATQAWADYQSEQAALSDRLVAAAQNITYGEAERQPIVTIATRVQAYADLIGQARAVMAAADPRQNTAPEAALALIRQASGIMNGDLLVAADSLNAANERVLDQTWIERRDAFLRQTVGLVAAGLPAVAVLLVLQSIISRRTRRRINPGLLAATMVMIVATLWSGFGAQSSASALTSAKQDAFDSVRALWKARAIAYSANADESYFLLDPTRKRDYTDLFHKKMASIVYANFDQPKPRQYFLDAIAEFERKGCRAQLPQFAFDGLLGDELRNVTFPRECEAAVSAYRRLSDYIAIDGRIRDLDAAGQRDAAIALNVGAKPGESNFAFDQFDQQLRQVIEINQTAFDGLIATATGRLLPLPWVIGGGCLLVGLLAGFGVRPRLNEYRS